MKFSIERCLPLCALFFCLLLSLPSFGQIYINTPTIYPSSTTISQNLIVNDTLRVEGDLTLANKVILTINAGGVVIIEGDLNTANKITLDIDSYLFVLGSLTHTGSDRHANAEVSDNSHVYIFGDFSSDFDGTDLGCQDADYQQGTINNCGHGKLDDFIEEEADNPIFEEVISKKLTPTNSLITDPADGKLCPLGGVQLIIQESGATNIFWYRDGTKFESDGSSSKQVSTEGAYYAIYKLGTQWYQTNEVMVITDESLPFISCPPDSTTTCIKTLSDPATSVNQFIARGGAVSDNCSTNDQLTIVWEGDVVIKQDGSQTCRVERSYTVTNEAGNSANCVRTFTITDTTAPEIIFEDVILAPNNTDCTANHSLRPVTKNESCGFINNEILITLTPNIPYVFDAVDFELTADFPLGSTTLEWTVTDECGNSTNFTHEVVVEFPLTPITYDGGNAVADNGPGMNPVQTSVHTYQVDGGINQSGYTYQWSFYQDTNNNGVLEAGEPEVNPAEYKITGTNEAEIELTYDGVNATIDAGNYLLAVTKMQGGATCEKIETLPIKVLENTFDWALGKHGPDCQQGETDTPTSIVWEISFDGNGVEPYELNYAIELNDGTGTVTICEGTIGNIRLAATVASLSHTSGCSDTSSMPFVTLVKNSGNPSLQLKYTVRSRTAQDFSIGITVDGSDVFSVSEIEANNNSEDLELWGVPNTSDIITD